MNTGHTGVTSFARTERGDYATNLYPLHLPRTAPVERVAVCVCTAYRPKMLETCLLSLREQLIDLTLALEIVIVDNEPEPNNQDAVTSLAYGSVYLFHYVHQPKRGIATARNAAVEKALELGADWIAFIDDDETAEPDWIAQLMAEEYRDVPVLMGAVHYVYPTPLPFWATPKEPKGYEGEICKTAQTGNVRLSAALVRAGLRFDERLGFMGGEDNEFFAHAYKQGWVIRRTMRAITREAAHPERLTYRGQLHRAYWNAASEMRRLTIRYGRLGVIARKSHTIPINMIAGMFWLAVALLAAPWSRLASRDWALKAGKKVANASGKLVALLGIKPQPYSKIVGR
jgi:succinoglycan biosynthesis protein ExoM